MYHISLLCFSFQDTLVLLSLGLDAGCIAVPDILYVPSSYFDFALSILIGYFFVCQDVSSHIFFQISSQFLYTDPHLLHRQSFTLPMGGS
jgi:hypothetical protein